MHIHSEKNIMFKKCPCCGTDWKFRSDFLEDSDIDLVGYQVHFEELTAGFFLFNHSCKTTMAIQVDSFTDLYDGPVFSARATESESCPQLCFHENNLESCYAECECAFVREILQIIREWPKKISNH